MKIEDRFVRLGQRSAILGKTRKKSQNVAVVPRLRARECQKIL